MNLATLITSISLTFTAFPGWTGTPSVGSGSPAAPLPSLNPPNPGDAPSPTLLGIWYLGSRSCTSGAEVRDGLEIGTDVVQMTYNPDLSFEEKVTLKGCETVTKGTYQMQDRKILTTSSEMKHCKGETPVPVAEEKVTFLAYLDENEAVTVTTGIEAAKVCPEEDALVKIFSKIILQGR